MPRPLRKVVLCILDGWGWREQREGNAVALARTPTFDWLSHHCPGGLLEAAGTHVGLPAGQIGNSEVGHTNLGAGRVVLQDLPIIDQAIRVGDLARRPAITELIAGLRSSGGRCHLMGLLSPGGVHSHKEHILALAGLLTEAGIEVIAHLFTDGRDVEPTSAANHLQEFTRRADKVIVGSLAGRYYAMDRDQRWERTARAYSAIAEGLTGGQVESYPCLLTALKEGYRRGLTDEFLLPCVIGSYQGMRPGDGLVMANFRADRVWQLLTALTDPQFDHFARPIRPAFVGAVGMKDYSAHLAEFWRPIFSREPIKFGLGESIAQAGWSQLRLAESEKYAHVTCFFNGGYEGGSGSAVPGEERVVIPSPKVNTYDLQPQMSAPEVTEQLVKAITADRFDLIVVNYANPDMVGHTGQLEAAVEAVEAVDQCLAQAVKAVHSSGMAMLVTADHGNCELMTVPESGEPHTAHTVSPVPVMLLNGPSAVALRSGCLADVAPTILELMGAPIPIQMSGCSLLDIPATQTNLAQTLRTSQMSHPR